MGGERAESFEQILDPRPRDENHRTNFDAFGCAGCCCPADVPWHHSSMGNTKKNQWPAKGRKYNQV